MNWDAIGAVGEVVGAAGVILTLLYLSVQIRTSNRASSVEAKLAFQGMYTGFLKMQVESPEIYEMFLRGRKGRKNLSEEEYLRFANLALLCFSQFSAGYFLHLKGTLEEADFHENLAVLHFWVRGEGTRDWWTNHGRHMYGQKFVSFVDSEIAQHVH